MMIDVDVDELMRDQAQDQREESSYPRGMSFITHDYFQILKIFHKVKGIKKDKSSIKKGNSRFHDIDVIQSFLVRSRSFEQRQ